MKAVFVVLAFAMAMVSLAQEDQMKSGVALIMAIQFWVGLLILIHIDGKGPQK